MNPEKIHTGGQLSRKAKVVTQPTATKRAIAKPTVTPSTAKRCLLSFNDVTVYRQRTTPVLNHVSFNVYAGDKTALIGYSGQGKTTILECIAKTIVPYSGNVIFDETIEGRTSCEHWQKIPLIDQGLTSLLSYYTVLQNVAFPHILAGEHKDDAELMAEECLNQVSLRSDKWDRYPKQISGGERQRVIIARSIACHGKLLIADEPFSALDANNAFGILDILQNLKVAVLLVTHQIDFALAFCNKLLLLDAGHINDITHIKPRIQGMSVRDRSNYKKLVEIAHSAKPR